MSKQWCSHITWKQGTDKYDPKCGVWYFLKTDENHWRCIVHLEEWDFCPVKGCKAPRPSEPKTLAEKFFDLYDKDYLEKQYSSKKFMDKLVEIATKHFEEKLDGKEVEEALSAHLRNAMKPYLGITESHMYTEAVLQFIKERILQ